MKKLPYVSASIVSGALVAVAVGELGNAAAQSHPPTPPPMFDANRQRELLFEGDSWVAVPLRLSVSDFAATVNALMPKSFHRKEDREVTNYVVEDYVEYTLSRGAIALRAGDGRLRFTIPVSGTITVGGQFNPLHGIHIGRGKHVQESADIRGTISGTLAARLDSDWSILPDITIEIEVDKAEVRLLKSIPISIKGILRDGFERNVAAIRSQVANELSSHLKMRQRALEGWQRLNVVKQIATSPPSWLSLSPRDLVAEDISVADDGQIRAGFGLRCLVTGTIGSEPRPVDAAPLPPLKIISHMPSDSHVRFPIKADLATIAATLNDRFSATSLSLENKEVRFRNIKLLAASNKLRAEGLVELGGQGLPKSVQLYAAAEGTPVIDNASKTIKIPDLTFMIPDHNEVGAIANWLIRPITDELRRRASYDYKADLDRLRRKFEASVQLVRDDHVSLVVSIGETSLDDLKVSADAISATATITGKAQLNILR